MGPLAPERWGVPEAGPAWVHPAWHTWVSHPQSQRHKGDSASSHGEACPHLPRAPCQAQLSIPCTCPSVPTPGFTRWFLLPAPGVYHPRPPQPGALVPWDSRL